MIKTKEYRRNLYGKRIKYTTTVKRTKQQYKHINELAVGDVLYSKQFGYCTIDSIAYDTVDKDNTNKSLLLIIVKPENGHCFSIGNSNNTIIIKTLLNFFYGDRVGLNVYNDMS